MDLEVASADDMFIKCGAKAVGMSAITWVARVTGMHLTGTVRGAQGDGPSEKSPGAPACASARAPAILS